MEKILCEKFVESESISENSVSLSLVLPPFGKADAMQFTDYFKLIMKKILEATKPGGICCLISSNDRSANTDTIVTNVTDLLWVMKDLPDWHIAEEIVWVKSQKSEAVSVSGFDSIEAVSFDKVPFSQILVLVKAGSRFEFVNRTEKLDQLKLSEKESEEMGESIWYIQPKSEKGYSDALPKEIVARLIMLYSNEGDVVLDPFAGEGITAVVSKTLKRKFVCVADSERKAEIAKKRISDHFVIRT